MIIAPLLLSWLAVAGAQHFMRPSSDDLESWINTYPEIRTPRISERVFRDNKEYRYLYDGQILTGLPETANQYSGLRIRAVVTVQLRSGVDVLKIEKATLGRIHERSIEKPLRLQPVADFEELAGEEAQEWNTALTKPIRFQYDDSTGTVSDLVSLESDPFWSVNIKRSILSTFNLKLKKNSAERNHPRFATLGRQQQQLLNQQSKGDNTEYFSVMEEGIGGECEAVYLIQTASARDVRSRLVSASQDSTEEVLNVTKSWNYENCNSRPIFLEELSTGVKCAEQQKGQFGCRSQNAKQESINSASHTRYNIVGNTDDYLIETAVTEAVHKFALYSDKAGSISAYVNATLRIIYAGELSRTSILPTEEGVSLRGLRQLFPQFPESQNNQHMWEASERARRQYMPSSGQWPNVAAKKVLVKALLERLVEDLADSEVQSESANLVLQMSVILAYATPEEITEIHREVKAMARQSVDQDQIENLWFDVLALTGTKPAVLYIKREIINGKLVGERAAQLLNTLAFSIRKPDQDIVNEVLTLCKEPTVTAHSAMKKACWLSFGTLAHSSCVEDEETTTSVQNTVVSRGNPHCNSETRRRFVIELLARMKSVQNEEDQILVLKTIKNTGFVEAVQDLKVIFSDDQQSIIIRSNAIQALQHIARGHAALVLSVLLPEYHDQTNPFQVRIAAFELIIEANPDLANLQLIARSLHNEKSMQVGSYVWSMLTSLANATHPCFEDLSENAALALEFGKPFQTGLSYSKGIHLDGFSDQLKIGGFAQISTVADPSSIIPRSVTVRLNSIMNGQSRDIIQAGVETTGISALMKKFAMTRSQDLNDLASVAALFNDYDADEFDRSDVSRRSTGRNARKSWNRPEFEEIDRLLGLVDPVEEEIKGSAYLKIFGQEVRFLTLSPKTIIKTIGEAYLRPSELAGLIRGVLPIDHRKALMAADSEITIPTELGLPLTVEMKAPVVVSVKGTIGLKTQPELSLATMSRMPQVLTVESDVKVSVATEIHGKMSVWAAYLKVGAGMRAQISTVIPLNGDITVDLRSGKIETSMDLPQEPLELINVEVIPMTYTKTIPKTLVPHQPDRKDVHDMDRSEKIVQYNRQPMENELPTEYFTIKTDLMENPLMLSKNGKVSTKFYEGLPVPVLDIKEMSTFDILKTKVVRATMGHPALGLLVDVRGQLQMANGVPHALLLPVVGKSKLVVVVRPSRAGLKSVSAAVHFRQQHAAASTRPVWSSLFDQLVDYNPSALLERLNADLPAAFTRDENSGFSAQLVIRGTTDSNAKEVAMQGVFSWVRGMDGKFVKVAAELSSPHPALPYQVCLNGHSEYPSEYKSWNLSPATNQPVTGHWELAVGSRCNAPDATKIKVSFVGDKSPQQLSWEKNDVYSIRGNVIPEIVSKPIEPMAYIMKPVWQECENDRKEGARWSPACETVKDIYSQLMQMKIDIDYQNIPRGMKVLLDKAEQLAHGLFMWNSEVDNVDVQNVANHMTIWANFSADQSDLVDIVYSTPKKNAKLLNIPVPFPVGPISADDEPMDFWESILNENLDEVCAVSGNRLNTLDNVNLKVRHGSCWSLLAKDCSVDELWSVLLAQAESRQTDSKKVMVFIGGNKIELQPASSSAWTGQLRSAGDVIVLVNGRPVQITTEKQPIAVDEDVEISLETDGDSTAPYVAISAKNYGLELWYDGKNVALKPTYWLRNQVCGLCGNNNGEEWDDMRLPNGQIAGSVEDLLRGYTVRKDGCNAESNLLQSASQTQFGLDQQQESECGKLKTWVKFQEGKVCFSVDPVESCPTGCNGVDEDEQEKSSDYMKVRRAGFHCLPENSSLAQRLIGEARRRVLTEISLKPVNDYFTVPQRIVGCGGRANGFRG